jgi:hypothetical protein
VFNLARDDALRSCKTLPLANFLAGWLEYYITVHLMVYFYNRVNRCMK